MLVLSRKRSEQITIGDDVTITVVTIKGRSVRIGIQAPSDMVILRQELEGHPNPNPGGGGGGGGMLVLSRKENEKILIGDEILITVLTIRSKVRLGIDAPKELLVLRKELEKRTEGPQVRTSA
jgi:carbon storage regulator